MTRFWFGHFTVSTSKLIMLVLVDWYEAEAIRPYILGRFRDMLAATTRHPAMIWYLDNVASVGPNSPVGRRGKQGLNENYARELLELHTLGVSGGYTLQDIREVAKVLSGWRVTTRPGEGAMRVAFDASYHEPGDKTIMGNVIRESGPGSLMNSLTIWRRPRPPLIISPTDRQAFCCRCPTDRTR
ncbi:DUF1800 family protein [Tistrella bauzanensis]